MQFLPGQLIADMYHARAGIRGIFTVRVAGYQLLEVTECIPGRIHVPGRAVRADQVVEKAFLHIEVGQPPHVQRIVQARVGRVVAHETLRCHHGGRVVHGHVLGVNQVQAGLFRVIAIGEADFQLLELVDGGQIVL